VHPEYAPATAKIAENTMIVLQNAGIIEGTVMHDSEPLEGATVSVRFLDRTNMPWMGSNSAKDGTYRISGLPPGEVEVSAEIAGNRRVNRKALVESGATTEVHLAFGHATSTVYGQVKAERYAPKRVNVQYRVVTKSGVESREVQVAPDGVYRLESLPAGQVLLSAQFWSSDNQEVKQFMEFELAEDASVRRDFEFSAKGTIAGRLQGLGNSLSGAVFVLYGHVAVPDLPPQDLLMRMWNEHGDIMVAQAPCDDTGAFAAEGLAPGTYTLIAVTGPKEHDASPDQMQCAMSIVEIEGDEFVPLDFDFR
jgi:hypothetical protein